MSVGLLAEVPALPLHEAGKYVAAAYIVLFALVLVYVAIMAIRLSRIERELGALLELSEPGGGAGAGTAGGPAVGTARGQAAGTARGQAAGTTGAGESGAVDGAGGDRQESALL
jgi:hypothetical protein